MLNQTNKNNNNAKKHNFLLHQRYFSTKKKIINNESILIKDQNCKNLIVEEDIYKYQGIHQ